MIVVTTPTGKIGSQVVKHLIAAHEAVRVIARDPSKLAPEFSGNVEVVEGSSDGSFYGGFFLMIFYDVISSIRDPWIKFLSLDKRGIYGRLVCGILLIGLGICCALLAANIAHRLNS